MTEPLWLTGCQSCARFIDNGEKPARWWLGYDDIAWTGDTTAGEGCDICMNSSEIYYWIATRPDHGEE